MLGSVVGWVVFGLIAGAIARAIYPGNQGLGYAGTIILGIAGSLLGGAIAFMLRLGIYPYQPAGWIFSILGSLVLLAFGFLGTRRRLNP